MQVCESGYINFVLGEMSVLNFSFNVCFLVFMCSTGFIKLTDEKANMELLGVAPIHVHPKSNNQPVYFSDVIILKDKM